VAAATAVTWGLRALGLEDPSAAFLAAILLCAWYAGPGPTVLAVVLSAVAWTFFVVHPVSSFSMGGPLAPHVVIFTMFAAVAAWFVSVRQQAAKRVEQARDELEERVRERTAHLDELFEQAPEAIALLETDGTVARVNREFARLFGYPPAEAVGRAIDALLVPEDLKEEGERFADRTTRLGERVEAETVRRGRDGTRVQVSIVGTPIVMEGRPVAEYVIYRDIRERKEAEERLRRSDRALRRARMRALEARYTAIVDERGRLAREIHDTLLQGFTGVALKVLAASNRVTGPPEAVTALQDVLVVARKTLEDARQAVWDMRSPPHGVGDFATALESAAQDSLRGTGMELEYAVQGTPRPMDPRVEAMVLRVSQEAIANAVKHSGAPRVRVDLSFEERGLRLSVKDDGQGFTVDPDFRSYGGHWGLLGMRERASQVRAKLAIRSAVGQGTEIVLLAPYLRARTAASPNGE
jgi:PAS domain S-box-containing protein